MNAEQRLRWLLQGDVSIEYQTRRDLMGSDRAALRRRITTQGWGARFLSLQREDGHWGRAYYQPKWISTHYTLLDLKHLALPPQTKQVGRIVAGVLDTEKGADGGINPAVTVEQSDVCLNGMFLNVASYFRAVQSKLVSIVDFILGQQMGDGGFNCERNRTGARHSLSLIHI